MFNAFLILELCESIKLIDNKDNGRWELKRGGKNENEWGY